MGAILEFSGEHRWLSNFAKVEVVLDGVVYPTVEHAYQAAKFLPGSPERDNIHWGLTPGQAKRRARMQMTSMTLRPDWFQVQERVMRALLIQKFGEEPYRSRLIATGDAAIEEGNTWGDRFWGVCGGVGDNRLGRLIMDIRETLQLIG